MGKYSREKGKRGERNACITWKEWGFKECKRVLAQSREGDYETGDLENLPFHVQVKSKARIVIHTIMEEQCPKNRISLLHVLKDGGHEYIVVRKQDIPQFVKIMATNLDENESKL